MDKMVEIARFTYPAEAWTLVAFLESEGINCYIRNELTTQIMAGYADVGGARVEVLESDLPRALELMQEGGYEIPSEVDDKTIDSVAGIASHIPFLGKYSLEKQIIILLAAVAILLALFVYTGSILSSN